MKTRHYTIPIFIPEMACPHRCVFCNQFTITGKSNKVDEDQIIRTIEEHLLTFREGEKRVEIGFFGGSFTGLPLDQQERFLSMVQPYLNSDRVSGIRLSTRPDYISKPVLELLAVYGVTTIELGAQSLDDTVLELSKRGHTAAQTAEASRQVLDAGFELGLQMMVGLPGDTPEKTRATASGIVDLGASSTRIYPALVIRDTPLHRWFIKGGYNPLTLGEAVLWTLPLVQLFEKAGIRILRMGLHPSEGILSGSALVAGPFHPAFRELVMTEIWSELLSPLLQLSGGDMVELQVPPGEENFAIGYRGQNKKRLLARFRKVRVVGDTTIRERGNFRYRLS